MLGTNTTLEALANKEWLDQFSVVLPWPILYETVNTRIARRRAELSRLDAVIRRPTTTRLDDSPYRIECYEKISRKTQMLQQSTSLVDYIMLAILDDSNVRIDAMLTFNHRDFKTFCAQKNIEYLL